MAPHHDYHAYYYYLLLQVGKLIAGSHRAYTQHVCSRNCGAMHLNVYVEYSVQDSAHARDVSLGRDSSINCAQLIL